MNIEDNPISDHPGGKDVLLEFRGLTKSFDGVPVLRGISLEIRAGEFITFLGPSGCGKTTTIRIIAGLESPDDGRVILDGRDITDDEPNKRPVNTVFQSYALFPHMSVAANVGYSLRLRKLPKAEIAAKVKDMLSLVQLDEFGDRMPAKLSGGQKQRVAIARSLINDPKILLLDEPLGALDLQLRRQMQTELKKLQKQLGITFIYITHDQEEAMNMSDRICVMRDGQFEQIGTPSEIYERPRTSFAAQFIGMANILDGEVSDVSDGFASVRVADGYLSVPVEGVKRGDAIRLSIRGENITYSEVESSDTPCPGTLGTLCGTVRENNYTGSTLRTTIALADGKTVIASRAGSSEELGIGDRVELWIEPKHVVPVDLGAADSAGSGGDAK